MIVYQENKEQFLKDVRDGIIEEKIEQEVFEKLHKHTPKNEFQSWMNSMNYMYRVMEDSRIPKDSSVAIEYRIPNSNKRVDFIVAGQNRKKEESAVVIELKQWQEVEKIDSKDGLIKTVLQGGFRETTHPSYQAWSYVSMIQDYNRDVRKNNIILQPCAYLHNYVPTMNPRNEND